MMHHAPASQRKIEKIHSAPGVLGSPRLHLSAPFSTFRRQKKILQPLQPPFDMQPAPCTDCEQRTQPSLIEIQMGAERWLPTNRREPTGKANAATPEYPQFAKNTVLYGAIPPNTV
jgi:hypothetical protein